MANNFEIGTTIGDYQIIGILGAGGMGKVYKVRNVISDRIEAMKVLLPDLATEAELADRFIREIKVQASLEHPNIASLHTALRVDNQLLMLMELVEGMSLDQKLKGGPLPAAEAIEYIAQVLAALGYAHQHGVIHRDIKPANMMLTPAGVVKLMDFGIAKAATDRKLTMTGTTLGSLYYMSPEQIKGAATLDARSDLYSIGVTLYELVTGRRPFDGDSQFAIMAAHLEKTPVPPITLDPRLGPELNDVILLSVAKEPEARFQTAEAFRNALLSIQGMVGQPAVAPVQASMAAAAPQMAPQMAPNMPPPPQPLPPITPMAAPPGAGKSHRGVWLALGGLFTALLVVAIVQFGPWKKTAAAPPEAPAATAAAAPAQAPVGDGGQGTGDGLKPAAQQSAPATPAPAPVVETAKPAPPQTAPAIAVPARSQRPPKSSSPAAAPAADTAPSPVPRPPSPAAAAAAQAAQAELRKVRVDLAMLATRASTAKTSLDTLRRSQAASGLNLRGDIAEAASLAANFISGANAALEAGDAASARDLMEKAESQVDKVEKFLGR